MLGTNLGAVLLVDLASFHGFVATVTAIVSTAFFVVVVVAIAVALVLRKFTSRLSQVVGVDALALQNIPKGRWNYGASKTHATMQTTRYLTSQL